MSNEIWPCSLNDSIDSHQCRDKLSRLCTQIGIPLDKWLSVRAIEAIELLQRENEKLLEDSEFLAALQAAGVDNWEGYEFACQGDKDD